MTLSRRALAIGAAVAAALVLILANAQLVQLAFESQPECIAHVKPGTTATHGSYSAAESSC